VLVYVPAYMLAGIVTLTVGVTVKSPIPVLASALKSSTGAGAVARLALRGYLMEFFPGDPLRFGHWHRAGAH
jgi:hypothetical protein